MPHVTIAFLALASVLLVAIFTDLRARRIPNFLVVAGWLFAAAWHGAAPVGIWAFDPQESGAVGVSGSLLGLIAMMSAFLPFYALRIMGAGDVKLLSVVGAFFGATTGDWVQLVGVSLFVLVSGGLLAISRMLARGSAAAVVNNLKVILAGYAAHGAGVPGPSFDPKAGTADRMPYAVAIATGTISYLVAKWAGWMTVL
ncbi:prepilin peptidase [Burkholderiaceae bacterium FT117]|uniref:A24 family peptidase n=1 Tax=Zeimonas sediminis TaxID=2944268 RepID=UPI00234308FF|nr:prepilin peptidase [Zeimonas sediminis]MCM5572088.1 prepilin peptidase [Zeimonas sediminis]